MTMSVKYFLLQNTQRENDPFHCETQYYQEIVLQVSGIVINDAVSSYITCVRTSQDIAL